METSTAPSPESSPSASPLTELPEVLLWVGLVLQQQQQLNEYRQKLAEQGQQISTQQQQIANQQQQSEKLSQELSKLKNRTSENSSIPPSQDLLKKPSRKPQDKQGKQRGPKYDHPGKTRNGFGQADRMETMKLEKCPICQGIVNIVETEPVKVQQVADLVDKPVEIVEYHQPKYQCEDCGCLGYAPLPWGVKAGFSYGGRLSSVIGWLGYGGNLTWHKQKYVIESIFQVPISQGSLAKMHRWFIESLEPQYQQWLQWVQEPGVRTR